MSVSVCFIFCINERVTWGGLRHLITVKTLTPRNVEWLMMFVMFAFKSSSVCFVFYVWQKWMIESRGNQGESLETPDNGRDFYPPKHGEVGDARYIKVLFSWFFILRLEKINEYVTLGGLEHLMMEEIFNPRNVEQLMVLVMKKSSVYFKFYFR